MTKKLKKHIAYYIALFIILGFGLIMVILVSYDTRLQMLIVFLIAFFYIIWGILHHLVHHDLTFKIVVEYILIGAFGMALVVFLLKGGLF